MNRFLISLLITIILPALLPNAALQASQVEDEYAKLVELYDQRDKSAVKAMQNYLKRYPYSTYTDEVLVMTGIIQVENRRYKQALKSFEDVKLRRLPRHQQPQYEYYRGYAYLMQGDYQKSITFFSHLKQKQTTYTLAAHYYYGYAQYKLGNYDKALPDFLAIEHTRQYADIVPYYIVQIMYAQAQDYPELIDRCQALLQSQPDNPNNAEIERILGEIEYAQGDYAAAVPHLKKGIEGGRLNRADADNDLLKIAERNDNYLLGVAYYQTADYPNAIRYLKQVPQKTDTISESTCLYLGHAYVHTQDIDKAKINYSAAMRFGLTPKITEEAMYNYALTTYQSATALGESVTALTDYIKKYPRSAHTNEIRGLLSDAFLRSKNYQAAYDALLLIPNTDTKMEQTKQYLRYQLGADAFSQNQIGKAQQFLSEVVSNATSASTPSDILAESYYLLAECAYRTQNYTAATDYLTHFESQSAYRQSPNRINALYLKGYAAFQLKRFPDAERAFTAYINEIKNKERIGLIASTYADAMNRIGDCRFNARNFTGAIQAYSQVISMQGAGADYALFQAGYAAGLQHKYVDKTERMLTLVTSYPQSDYADDALYEMARAYIEINQPESAIIAYERLLDNYPNSNLGGKTSLEEAMIYRNLKNYDQAIRCYKRTINDYPGSEYAYSALDGLEQVYVETNNISEYLAYTKKLGKTQMRVSSAEDSLMYVTAELQYMLGNYEQAAAGFATYLTRFCAGSRYCTNAHYYVADAYMRLNQPENALAEYEALAALRGNPYREEATIKAASLTFDAGNFSRSMTHFQNLEQLASSESTRQTAKLGVLRCAFNLNDDQAVIQAASQILDSPSTNEQTDENIIREARYYRGKAYVRAHQNGLAVADLTPIAADVRSAEGAEAKYLLAQCYFNMGALDNAEAEISSFAQMSTQHQYWLAKAMLLLADISLARQDTFQAKQYVLSLQANYRNTNDDIQALCTTKLQQIEQLETAAAAQAQADLQDEE